MLLDRLALVPILILGIAVLGAPVLGPRASALQEPSPAPPSQQRTGEAQQTAPPAQTGGQTAPSDAEKPSKAASSAAVKFSSEQLDQIAAPIALHPDQVLSHVLMASTYPLEIVEAARWLEKNPKLSGDALENALKGQDWDPSVKALCGFSAVLKTMNEDLDWTQDLGDAFLGQREELMQSIQRMRQKAKESGNLETTKEQTVTQEGSTIVIESSSPDVIYVPSYSPTVVYGSWAPPYYYYPPMYAPPPPGYGLMAFSVGVTWGAAIWGDCDWNSNDVDIDINQHNEFNSRTDRDSTRNRIDSRGGGTANFNHNPEHRRGVNYKDPGVARQAGATGGGNRVSREQARGYGSGTGSGTAGTSRAQAGRTGGATEASAGRGTTGSTSSASRTSGSTASSSRGDSALRGSSSPSLDRSASSRGATSRASAGARGGASRGGGGMRGGGGGRGGGGRR